MRSFLAKGLVFVGVSMVLYALCFGALTRLRSGGSPLVFSISDYYHLKGGPVFQKFTAWNASKHYDVLVLGSSHAYRGYDPALFAQVGYTCVNLGSSAQSVANSYHLLRAYAQASKVGLVLLDVYDVTLEVEDLESTSDLVANVGDHATAARLALGLGEPRALNLFALRLWEQHTPPYYRDSTCEDSGYCHRADSVSGPVNYNHRPFDPRQEQVDALRACARLCQERGIPLVMVTHPYPKSASRPRHAACNAIVAPIARSFGVPYLDHAFDHDLHDQHHFYDHNHMNRAGVGLFNPKLIQELVQLGYLRPRS
jgi:hypothetical protein